MGGVQGLKELRVTTYLAPHDPCHSPELKDFVSLVVCVESDEWLVVVQGERRTIEESQV